MAKRTRRGTIDKPEVLAKLHEGRRGAMLVCATAEIDGNEYVHLRLPHENDRGKTSRKVARQVCACGRPMD